MMEDLTGAWKRGVWRPDIRLVVDRGGQRVFVMYADGNVGMFPRGYVSRFWKRVR